MFRMCLTGMSFRLTLRMSSCGFLEPVTAEEVAEGRELAERTGRLWL
jgi:hypothetical protein